MKNVILKVLKDESYARNAKKWSARFRDQKEKPLDRAIWWIEWLLRNPNCEYLKSPVHQLGFIAGNAYDIIACVTLIFAVVGVLIMNLLCYCTKKMLKKNENLKHKKTE